jgi:apolipoprotein N-acyltransferase
VAVWVAFEFARNLWLWPHGSAACIAYSQLNFLLFLQLASIAGPWGMGFVLMLFPNGLALAIDRWGSGQAMRVLGATLGVVAAALIFGAVRLAIPRPGPEETGSHSSAALSPENSMVDGSCFTRFAQPSYAI